MEVPFNLWVDQAKAFNPSQFKPLASALECNIFPITVEVLWSSIARGYHEPLLRTVEKLGVDHPTWPFGVFLDYLNLAVSHAVGLERFTSAILAFGAQPLLPIGNYKQTPQSSVIRMNLMIIARREYEAIVSRLLVKLVWKDSPPN